MVTEINVAANNRPVFSLSFDDKLKLYQQYMPFIQNGALFISTSKTFYLGDEVSLFLALADDAVQHSCPGRVVWITPLAAERGLTAGIGVQLVGEEALSLRDKIEAQLMGLLNVPPQNDTM